MRRAQLTKREKVVENLDRCFPIIWCRCWLCGCEIRLERCWSIIYGIFKGEYQPQGLTKYVCRICASTKDEAIDIILKKEEESNKEV